MSIRIFVNPKSFVADTSIPPLHIIEAQLSDLPHEAKVAQYGMSYTEFELVNDIQQADIALMPYEMQVCVELGIFDSVFLYVEEARQAGIPFVVWTLTDECLAPKYHKAGIISFAETGFRSLRQPKEFCSPWFADDPIAIYCDGYVPIRRKTKDPIVGFCGRADATISRIAWQVYRNGLRALKAGVGITPFVSPRIISEVAFRARIINLFEKNKDIKTKFILRKRYFAGVRDDSIFDPNIPVKMQFIDNIMGTDYTICMRGSGNWSMRLYETLACGRIPIYVDTDTILPYDFAVDWREHVLWVEEHEIPHIAEKVLDFHHSMTDAEFVNRQRACRKLWVDRLSRDGFFAHFHEHLIA